MSTWSLACRQSVFHQYHSEKHLQEFYSQGGGESHKPARKLRHCHRDALQLLARVDVIFAASVEHFPEHPTSYLFDVIKDTLSRTKDFYLLVQRTGWFYPLHLDSANQTYVNMMYQQIRPDFLDGNMLVFANKTLSKSLRVSLLPTNTVLSKAK